MRVCGLGGALEARIWRRAVHADIGPWIPGHRGYRVPGRGRTTLPCDDGRGQITGGHDHRRSMMETARWFGRARRMTARKRLAEVLWDTLYFGGWPARLGRQLGFQ